MTNLRLSLTAAACGLLFAVAASTGTAAPSDYQATGPIVAITDSVITIEKGKEKWEVARDATTKGPADLKVGDKVTIHYTMTATTIEAKPAADSKKKPAASPAASPAAH